MLCALIEREVPAGAPLLVAGDFNDWCQRAHDVLADGAGLGEVFITAFGQAARTFPVWLPLLRLDSVYVRNLHVEGPRRLVGKPWRRLSDHAPLLLHKISPQ